MASWISQLTAGLIYDGIGPASTTIEWSKSQVWSPDWFSANMPAPVEYAEATRILNYNQEQRSALDRLTWQQGWSAHPKPYPEVIYSFQIHYDRNKEVIVRHKFYNRYTWYVQFKSSKNNIAKLLNRLGAS